MKKLVMMLMLILIASGLFAQVEIFGDIDVWTYDPADTEINGNVVRILFHLDIDATKWTGFIPEDEGLREIIIVFDFFTDNPDGLYFSWNYLSEYDLLLPNYITIRDGSGDNFMLGGRVTYGDTSWTTRNYNGTYSIGTGIYPDLDWMNWFLNNATGSYTFGILEFNYNDNLWFNVPAGVFEKLREVYGSYNGAYRSPGSAISPGPENFTQGEVYYDWPVGEPATYVMSQAN